MAGLVAVAPAGSESEDEPPATFQGSLPDTTFAPPDSVQACVPGSNEPPGTVVYEALSPNPANGVLSAFALQLRAVDTSSPAFAVGATIATAVATAARARVLMRRAVTSLFLSRTGRVPFPAVTNRYRRWRLDGRGPTGRLSYRPGGLPPSGDSRNEIEPPGGWLDLLSVPGCRTPMVSRTHGLSVAAGRGGGHLVDLG